MKKRLLSVFLALAMMLTLLPVSVFAADENGGDESKTGATVSIPFSSLSSQSWTAGDTVQFKSGSSAKVTVDLTFTYKKDEASKVDPPEQNEGENVKKDENPVSDLPAEQGTGEPGTGEQGPEGLGMSATVNLPVFFAGAFDDWSLTAGTLPSGYASAGFDGSNLLLSASSGTTPTAADFSGMTATPTNGGTAGSAVNAGTVSVSPAAEDGDGDGEGGGEGGGTTDTGVTTPDELGTAPSEGYLPGDKVTAGSVPEGASVSRATSSDDSRYYGSWYYQTKNSENKTVYILAGNGIVVGNRWYSTPTTYVNNTTSKTYPSNFTIVAKGTADVSNAALWPTSMKVELDGGALTLPSTIPANVSRLEVNNDVKYGGMATSASKIGDVKRVGTTTAFTLKVTNASVGSVDLSGSQNTVTIIGGAVGAITMDGKYNNGKTITYNRQTLGINSENGQTSAYNTIMGNAVSVTNGDNSQINLHNATGSGVNVTYSGNTGTITVSGTSNLGTISYATRVVSTDSNKRINPATVTVHGGTIGTINNTDADSTGTATITVGNAQITSAITINKLQGKVAVNAGTTGGAAITVPEGDLTITGTPSNPTTVGNITIGNIAGSTSKLTVSGGKVTGGDITSNSGTKLTLSIPKPDKASEHPYVFGDLTLGDYAGHGIKGGTFKAEIDEAKEKQWLDTDLTFRAKLDNSPIEDGWTLYGSKELNQVFSDLGKTKAAASGNLVLAGQKSTETVTLKNGKADWGIIGYSTASAFYLPTMMFGTPVAEWVHASGSQAGTVVKDNRLTTPGIPASLELTNKRSIDIATGITSITSNPQGVRAVLSGSVINLSGAVRANDGSEISSIMLTLGTNIEDEAGTDQTTNATGYKKAVVEVVYNTKTKETYFNSAWGVKVYDETKKDYVDIDPAVGIKVEENRLSMNDGKVVYTVNGSGLGVPASNLKVYEDSTEIQASVTKNGVTEAAKRALVEAIAKSADGKTLGEFAWTDAYAIWEGVNAALKTYSSETTVNGWITNAQSTIWRSGLKDPVTGAWMQIENGGKTYTLVPHSGNFKASNNAESSAIAAAFAQAYLVPYLQVNVTDYTSDYTTITANLVPSYRIIVSVGGDAYTGTEVSYVVSGQTGKSLGTLTGSMTGGATVKFATLNTGKWAHQDATYGYEKDSDGKWTIDHVGAKDGLGTFVFNSTEPLITLTHKKDAYNANGDTVTDSDGEVHYYDTLQAAVDDTLPQRQKEDGGNDTAGVHDTTLADVIEVNGRYQGSYAISVGGLARTFVVKVEGEKQLSVPSSDLIKATKTNSNEWTVQLLEDTGVVANGNITIRSATGGSARVSSNPASEGQTVTITLTPESGYRSSGVTVRTASGENVAVNGSGNSYNFVMPSGSVIVTPSFTVGSASAVTTANVTVSSNTMGSATTNVVNGQTTGGSVVGVTTYPNAGYRTMGVNVSTNSGSTTATRTGDNTFNFTVPANATAVTVTPVYDVDNGTKFADVWSTSYYSNAVSWAVGMGITGGQSTYSFGSGNTCSRADMVTFLYRAAGSPSVANVRNPFVDVPAGSYYYNAVMWAYSKGITGGVDTTHFGPNQTVTRAQTVTFLYRYAGEPAVGTNSGFYDVPSNQWYAKAVTWARNQGVTGGKTATSFAPSSGCMRCEIVTFLYRDLTGNRA